MALLMMVVGLLAAVPARAYELHTTEDGHVVRWQRAHIVLELSHEAQELGAATGMAVDSWRGFPGVPDLEITRGHDLGPPGYDGRNGVYVARSPDRREGHLAVTVLTTNRATGEILDADVLVDPEMLEELALLDEHHPRRDRFDSASLLAHELGHVLGLDDTSDPHREATMWGRLKRGDTGNRTLDPDDEAGVLAAYRLVTTYEESTSADPAAAFACSASTTGRAQPPRATAAAAALALLLLTLRRRQRAGRARQGLNGSHAPHAVQPAGPQVQTRARPSPHAAAPV